MSIPLFKKAKEDHKIYHYTYGDKSSIEKHGLLTPAKIVESFDTTDLIDTYKERIMDIYSGDIDDSTILDYLDFQFGNILPKLYAGRNVIYTSFGLIPEGISKGHDHLRKGDCWAIDIVKLIKDLKNKIELVMIEIPTDDPKKPTQDWVDLEQIKDLIGKDLLTNKWDAEGSDGFLFGNIPHLAIWLKDGMVEPEYLELIDG